MFSLKNHGAEVEVDDMFDMSLETLDLPDSEKMKFEQGDGGDSFGYGSFLMSTWYLPPDVRFSNYLTVTKHEGPLPPTRTEPSIRWSS